MSTMEIKKRSSSGLKPIPLFQLVSNICRILTFFLDQWYDIILSLAYLGSQLNRTVIMPVVYRTNSPKQLSEMLRRYIQQTTLHHQEFDFAQIKVKYGLNETYEELSKKIQLPEVYYDKVIYSKEEFEKLMSKLNNTKSKLNEEEYQKYSSLAQQVKEEKEQLDLFFNRYLFSYL